MHVNISSFKSTIIVIITAIPQYHLLEASIDIVKSTQCVAHESARALRGFTNEFRIERTFRLNLNNSIF